MCCHLIFSFQHGYLKYCGILMCLERIVVRWMQFIDLTVKKIFRITTIFISNNMYFSISIPYVFGLQPVLNINLTAYNLDRNLKLTSTIQLSNKLIDEINHTLFSLNPIISMHAHSVCLEGYFTIPILMRKSFR